MTRWEKRTCSQLQLYPSVLFFKKYFATKPFTKPQGKTIFQKTIKIQKQGSRNQAKIIPQNSAVAKNGRKPNFHSSLETTFKKNSENHDYNYNGVEFKIEVILKNTACSAWEYIRLSPIPAEIKI